MSDPIGPNSVDSFVEFNWTLDLTADTTFFKDYPRMDLELTIYENSDYDTYVSFLNSQEAENKINEDYDWLSSNSLTNFQ